MSKVNLAISGCMGRMGQQLVKSSRVDKNFKLTTLTENRLIKKKISGIKPSLNNENSFKNVDLIIDFTVPKCTFEILKIASKLKKRVVIGTTGFSKKEENLILQKILEEHYMNVEAVEIPSEIIIQYNIPKQTTIEDWITELRKKKVKIIIPKRNKNMKL